MNDENQQAPALKNDAELQPSSSRIKNLHTPALLTLVLVLAIGYTLYFAAELLIPITFSIFLGVLFFPLVRFLARFKIPRSLTSAIIVVTLVAMMANGITMLSGPAETWLSDAPRSISQLRKELAPKNDSLANVQALANEVDGLTAVEQDKSNNVQNVVVQERGAFEAFIGNLPKLASNAIVIIFLTFFILVNGETLLRKITRCGRTWSERRRIVSIARHIQSELSSYLATVTIINLTLGAATALALFILEVDNPWMWGTMVAVFNFAPYVGALVSLLILTVVGLTTFPSVSEALIVPGAFLILTTIEGQLITPSILGRNMSLNSMMVFIAIVIWGWIWGIAGALMAVPILVSFKVICQHSPSLYFVGELLAGEKN